MSDDQTFDLLGITGPYICHKCGHPFEAGDRAVYLCGGEKVKDSLSEKVKDSLNLKFGETEDDTDIITGQRMTVFNLVHEKCEI